MEEESKASDYQNRIESKFRNFGKGKYGRILKMARTPTHDEYKKTITITGIGIILIGALGFVIMWLMTYLPTYF
jgi:protein transport protein SEC61 subunit gamma-like protein